MIRCGEQVFYVEGLTKCTPERRSKTGVAVRADDTLESVEAHYVGKKTFGRVLGGLLCVGGIEVHHTRRTRT